MQLNVTDFHIFRPEAECTKPDISFIPPMQRRRLSLLSAMAVWVAEMSSAEKLPMVFASRQGEWQTAAKQLEMLYTEGEVSPAAFGLSVHNTAPGFCSLLKANHLSYSSVAAGSASLCEGFIEAASCLSRHNKVLYIYAEETRPALYESVAEETDALGMAMVLQAGGPVHIRTGIFSSGTFESFISFMQGRTDSLEAGSYFLERLTSR